MTDWDTRFRDALKKEHEQLFDAQTKSIKTEYAQYVACPVCDSNDATPYLVKDWFKYMRCSNCSMVYMNPRLNDSATFSFYNSEANEIYNEAKFHAQDATLQDDKINFANVQLLNQHRGQTRGNLLEIGSAKGFFLKAAKESGYNVYGLELNKINWQNSHAHISENILNTDLVSAAFPSEMFDVIYMRDVIEHLPNPKQILQECFRIAKKGCTILLETHNIDSLINAWVREKHSVIFGFEHINHWSPKTLKDILARCGFSFEKVEFMSIDFTYAYLLHYHYAQSFTTVFPAPQGELHRFTHRVLSLPLKVPGIKTLDSKIGPRLANRLQRGSVMKVFATKKS